MLGLVYVVFYPKGMRWRVKAGEVVKEESDYSAEGHIQILLGLSFGCDGRIDLLQDA